MTKCKFCNHNASKHPENMDGFGCCSTIGCFCRARRQIIEKVEGLK